MFSKIKNRVVVILMGKVGRKDKKHPALILYIYSGILVKNTASLSNIALTSVPILYTVLNC